MRMFYLVAKPYIKDSQSKFYINDQCGQINFCKQAFYGIIFVKPKTIKKFINVTVHHVKNS